MHFERWKTEKGNLALIKLVKEISAKIRAPNLPQALINMLSSLYGHIYYVSFKGYTSMISHVRGSKGSLNCFVLEPS